MGNVFLSIISFLKQGCIEELSAIAELESLLIYFYRSVIVKFFKTSQLIFALLMLSAPFVNAQSVQIKDAFARATNPGQSVGGGYLTIENPNTSPDKLVSVSYAKASSVQIHEMKMEGDKMIMRDIGTLVIPAKSKVELKPGGYHLMLMGLKEQLNDGDVLPITLQFEKAGKVDVSMPVRAMSHGKMH
jgi:copper(I)-binding protein